MLFCQVWLRFIVCLLNVAEWGNLTQLRWCPTTFTILEGFVVKYTFYFIPSTLWDHILFIILILFLHILCQYASTSIASLKHLPTLQFDSNSLAVLQNVFGIT